MYEDIKEFLLTEQKKIDLEDDEEFKKNALVNPQPKKELIKKVINQEKTVNMSKLYGIYEKNQAQLYINPKVLYKSHYLFLDNANKASQSITLQELFWFYSYNAIPFEQGLIRTTGKIKNIIGMRVFPIVFFRNNAVPIFSNMFSLQIREFRAQSFICHQAWNAHFFLRYAQNIVNSSQYGQSISSSLQGFTTFNRANQASPMTLVPTNDGYYWFEKPISEVSTFTALLANPIQQIFFPVGIVQVRLNTTSIVVGATTSFSVFNVGWSIGQLVLVSGFTTLNPVADAATIEFMNRSEGHLISNVVGNNIFLPVNTTGLSLDPNPFTTNTINLRNVNTRLIIPLEIITSQVNDSE